MINQARTFNQHFTSMFQFVLLSALVTLALSSNPAGQAYLDQNAKKDKVVSLPSGLQYEIERNGPIAGATPKSTSDRCTCHYEGKLIDGTIFDSSLRRGSPSTFSPNGVIGGWTEALMLMRPGDKWILTIPSHLAYGESGSGSNIPGGAVLIFSLELIAVKESSLTDWFTLKTGAFVLYLLYMVYSFFNGPSRKDVAATKVFSAQFLTENKTKDGVISLPSGLQYKVLRQGKGTGHPLPGTPCSCHYEGRCAADYPTGKKFDSSYDRGSPTTFAPNQVIGGWTEAMQLMVEGDKWEMYIPSHLAYGDQGRVPGCLVFTMEIVQILGNTRPSKKDD
jgi:FKBP-type peptidyl-prolyl cis-trans isomerase